MRPLKDQTFYIFLLFMGLFILYKTGYLSLPYYWDEAWSYATAVFDMAEKGLLHINPDLTRGHPLLFYAVSALWVKTAGTNPFVVHILPLIVSITLLVFVYVCTGQMTDKTTALSATVLFMLQSVFLAQSTMLLPEIMLALWSVLTFYVYVQKRWGLYVFFSVLLVMTKETGIVLTCVLLIDKMILEGMFLPGTQKKRHPGELWITGAPVIAFVLFTVFQKLRFGWFLYPDHLNLTIDNPVEIAGRIRIFLSRLLFINGRNIFFFLMTGSLIYLIIKKQVTRHSAYLLILTLFFILLYIIFSSVNFFTTRYLLSIIPFYMVAGSWIISRAFQKIPAVRAFIFAVLSGIFAYYTFIADKNPASDSSLSFKHTVTIQREAVHYAESMQWHQKSVYSVFLMQYYLSDPRLGYLQNKDHPFTDIGNKHDKPYDIYLFCSNENDPFYDSVKDNRDYTLIKRFENKGAWVAFFRKTTTE